MPPCLLKRNAARLIAGLRAACSCTATGKLCRYSYAESCAESYAELLEAYAEVTRAYAEVLEAYAGAYARFPHLPTLTCGNCALEGRRSNAASAGAIDLGQE